MRLQDYLQNLPKVELHLHIEGTLEPEMMFALADRNQVKLPYKSVDEIALAYEFENLQSFLDLYYAGTSVLLKKEDFFDLTWAYFLKCQRDHVVHTEIFFDPQTHSARGVDLKDVIEGITQAMQRAKEELGISSFLIACILRHLSQEEGIATLQSLLPYKHLIKGIGLDSSEVGHPPSKFRELFALAKEEGFLLVAHAGEEGDSTYIQEALDLGVERIDHGVRCEDDPKLVDDLKTHQIPLTMCPLSNLKLKVFSQMSEHNLVRLLRKGLRVCVNSDDPAYFGGYIGDNFLALSKCFDLSKEEYQQLSLNAIESCFLSENEKQILREKVKNYEN